jgi:hypothetical protein
MRIPSFRIRTLMIAIALLAVLLGRWMNFKHRAHVHHGELERILISNFDMYLACTPAQGDPYTDRYRQALNAVQPIWLFMQYQEEMEQKYLYAFRRPWLPVASDPPAPARPSDEYQRAFRAAFLPGIPYEDRRSQTPFPRPRRVVAETVSQ